MKKSLDKWLMALFLFMFVFGLILPDGWRGGFWLVGDFISIIASSVPSIGKFSSSSPVPNLVQGFFGVAVIVIVLWEIAILVSGSPQRVLINAIHIHGWGSYIRASMISIPFFLLMLWLFYEMPGDMSSEKITWGGYLLKSMLAERFGLSVIGSILVLFCGIAVHVVAVMTIGPVLYLMGVWRHE